ncbi:hypothetical protein [uncultured Methanobrevibacter sp.]|uniref:hypothetical protein n=1 Tax=uncultured Methanobrevibacter sp. TaxID=253161 RepID=UPI0025E6A490|nr:hypothetical protein [uncultured Methanobrevibacter sp.]
MENTKNNRRNVIKKQMSEFGKYCYLTCTSYKDKTNEIFELDFTNYRAAGRYIANKFRQDHSGFCVCMICYGDGITAKTITI